MFRAGAITVSADEGRGNNGDVKIHAVGTATTDDRNEPHVCSFYIGGFKFDTAQAGTWTIVGQAPTSGATGSSGTWGPADNDGNWSTAPMTLVNGHYKLTVNTGKGDGKHKVFWVECGTTAGNQATPPPANGGQQNNGNGNNNSGERSSVPTKLQVEERRQQVRHPVEVQEGRQRHRHQLRLQEPQPGEQRRKRYEQPADGLA